MDITPLQIRSPVRDNVVQEAAEKALGELVIVRQMEVERLERELDALRSHCTLLYDNFSVPIYPLGMLPLCLSFRLSSIYFLSLPTSCHVNLLAGAQLCLVNWESKCRMLSSCSWYVTSSW